MKTSKQWVSKSIWLWLLLLVMIAALRGNSLLAQHERPRERDTRRDRTERERKGNENEKLDRSSDRVTERDEKLSGKNDSVTDSNEKLTRETKVREDESLKEKSGTESGREREDTKAREQGFQSQEKLDDHYEKHVIEQREFGQEGISKPEYLRRARELRDTPADGHDVKQIDRKDGSVSKYDTRSNSFGAYDRDGTIKTYFKPVDGEAYFHDQARQRE